MPAGVSAQLHAFLHCCWEARSESVSAQEEYQVTSGLQRKYFLEKQSKTYWHISRATMTHRYSSKTHQQISRMEPNGKFSDEAWQMPSAQKWQPENYPLIMLPHWDIGCRGWGDKGNLRSEFFRCGESNYLESLLSWFKWR